MLGEARTGDGRPTLVRCRTHIGFGAPGVQDTNKAHGAPLGEEQTRLAKEAYGWPPGAEQMAGLLACEYARALSDLEIAGLAKATAAVRERR
mgnify:CR=1 FL=1